MGNDFVNHILMQSQSSLQGPSQRRLQWIGAALLTVVLNTVLFLAFFDKVDAFMIRGVSQAAVICGACSLLTFSFQKNKARRSVAILLSFVVVILVNYIEFKIHEFHNPNAEKWEVLGLFFAPFYVAPTVFGVSLFTLKFLKRESLRSR